MLYNSNQSMGNYYFVSLTLISLTLFNYTNFLVRPIELIIPVLFVVAVANIDKLPKLSLGALLIFILFLLSQYINYEVSEITKAITHLRNWLYLFLYLVLASLISKLKFWRFDISMPLLIGISLIVAVYILSKLGVPLVRDFFTPYRIMYEENVLTGKRVIGNSFHLLGVVFLLFYLGVVKRYVFLIALSALLLVLILSQSRTQLLTYAFFLFCLFGRFNIKSFVILGVLTLSFVAFIATSSNSIFLGRLNELTLLFESPGFIGRMMELGEYLNRWLSNPYSFLFGSGLGSELNYYRYHFEYDIYSNTYNLMDDVFKEVSFHSADNLLAMVVTDGGLILLLITISVLLNYFRFLFKQDKRIFFAFLSFFAISSITGRHLITDYSLIFLFALPFFILKESDSRCLR
ncbi:hypothetical protein INT50_01080 [Vibrio diabolicus]|uniref:hypothetical protein n=1 Tax=Vibrio TaxID=662 RepID=UPI0013DFA83C|nr:MULTISPECIES: hypothetical protein [Vibrio]MDW2022526.1 hypothetical protein [Vibrio sp. 397]MDW2027493.1 hypothetical protein [Vibrio sp. 399]MDW2213671.1 hypothetical protein [Vibrio sp. 1982]QOV30128.1 hypothetical protein INT50_01080 [Vibrio diabolicus]